MRTRCLSWMMILLILFSCAGIISRSFHEDDSRGIFEDQLDDDAFIDKSMSTGYELKDGYATIKFEESSSRYTPERVFYRENTFPIYLAWGFIGPDNPTEKELIDKSSLTSLDNISFRTNGSLWFFVPSQHFIFKVDQKKETVSAITLSWSGSFDGDRIKIYAWDYDALSGRGMWKFQGEIERGENNLAIGGSEPCRFVSGDGRVDILVMPTVNLGGVSYISTDYVSIDVKGVAKANATLVTKTLEPGNLWRWEFVEWNGYQDEHSSIKVQVLDSNGRVLEDIEGNDEGFEGRIIPLNDLSGISGIRLRFYMETTNPPHRPMLSWYRILWLREDRWRDDFATNYRIEEKSDKEIISKTIFLPRGYWWDRFEARVDLHGGNITFSILDGSGKEIISDIEGRSFTTYDISQICTRSIKLKAEIEKKGTSPPEIREWIVTFSREDTKPIIIAPSIIYLGIDDVKGKRIDVEVSCRDEDPGICAESGRYRLEYTDNVTGLRYYSRWLHAIINETNCSKRAKMVAHDISIFYNDSLKDILPINKRLNLTLSGIDFMVRDMAGNENRTSFIDVVIDTEPPVSRITTDVEEIGYKHGYETIEISADATDDVSNIRNVTLYYMVSCDNISFSEPKKYSTLNRPPWKWEFEPTESGYYKFFTIAVDNAGNLEAKDEGELTLLIDINEPDEPIFEDRVYWLNDRRIDFVSFYDDLSIDTIEYRIGGEEYFGWKEIADGVGTSFYEESWEIDVWDWERMENGKIYPIYFRIRDLVGNEYVTPDDGYALKVGKDVIPPYSYLEPIKLWQYKRPVEISSYVSTGDGSDISKVILMYRYSADNRTWSEWKVYDEEVFTGSHTWFFDPEEGDGYYQVRLISYDSAGNSAESTISFGITILPQKEIIIMLSMFVILLISSAIVSRELA